MYNNVNADYKFGYYSEYDWYVDEILKSAPWHTYVPVGI